MKIAIVSGFMENYPIALEHSYARAFKKIGHDVTHVSTHVCRTSQRGIISRFEEPVLARLRQGAIRRELLESNSAFVVIVKGMEVLPSTINGIKRHGVRVVNVFPDNPFDVIGKSPQGGSLLEHLRLCDMVYVHDRFVVGQLRQLGVRSEFIAFARDEDYYEPPSEKFIVPASAKIAFVGDPNPERIRYLRAIADFGLGLWGRWDRARLTSDDPLSMCVRGGEVVGPEMARILGTADISINILRWSQKTAHNMRTFESPACGVCAVSEISNGVLELMQVNREVVTFSTPLELREVCLRLLDDPERRRAIGQAGWERVKNDTYVLRAQQILAAA